MVRDLASNIWLPNTLTGMHFSTHQSRACWPFFPVLVSVTSTFYSSEGLTLPLWFGPTLGKVALGSGFSLLSLSLHRVPHNDGFSMSITPTRCLKPPLVAQSQLVSFGEPGDSNCSTILAGLGPTYPPSAWFSVLLSSAVTRPYGSIDSFFP